MWSRCLCVGDWQLPMDQHEARELPLFWLCIEARDRGLFAKAKDFRRGSSQARELLPVRHIQAAVVDALELRAFEALRGFIMAIHAWRRLAHSLKQ